jgi:glycosyltransferase involved in cell wall biosynthesis
MNKFALNLRRNRIEQMIRNRSKTRLLVSMKGSLRRESMMQIKYGQLVRSLHQHITLAGVYDTNLRGAKQMLIALKTWHPKWRSWRERYSKHPTAFKLRSIMASRWVVTQEADAVLQLGAMFDSSYHQDIVPNVIYTDYTSHLSAQHRQGNRSPYRGGKLDEWLSLEQQAYRNAAHVCVRSDTVRKSIIEDYAIPPEKVSVVGGGASLGALPDAVTRPIGGPPRVLFIGQDFHRKGGDLVLKAFAEARKIVPQSRLTMVTRLPRNHGLPLTNVEVIESGFDREIIRSQFPLADVFVLPSRLETWGDVILEAMAFGIACIGVTGQPMEEIIVHEKTGLLVEPENTAALGEAIARLLSDRTYCRMLGAMGRTRLEEEYTWSLVAGRLSQIIEMVASDEKN